MKGFQQRLACPNCGEVFFAWRPEDRPGAKVKCYFCRHEFEDEAALRGRTESPETKDENPEASVQSK